MSQWLRWKLVFTVQRPSVGLSEKAHNTHSGVIIGTMKIEFYVVCIYARHVPLVPGAGNLIVAYG